MSLSLSSFQKEGPRTSASRRRTKLCFVAPNAYAALAGRSDLTHIGGAEVQQVLVAKALHLRGHQVCFITWDHGQPDGVTHDGITVFKTCRPDAGLPGLRFIHPRWTGLYRALRRADADVYYQRAAGIETGQVALWCRYRHRPFLFAAASDGNCDPTSCALKGYRERALFRFGVRRATRVICQSKVQQDAWDWHWGIRATRIRSCALDPFDGRSIHRTLDSTRPMRLLWVGRFHAKKRPSWILDLAEACPQTRIDVVGDGRQGDSTVEEFLRRASRIAHVTLHGRLAPGTLGPFYDQADLLICTSLNEGFPNTFLEAWARGTPTVSTFDPDGIISRHRMGAAGHTIAELRDAVERFHASPDRWADSSRQARAFFLKNHTVSAAADAYENVLREISNEQVEAVFPSATF